MTSTPDPTADRSSCCSEYAAVSRRGFLTGTAALVGTTTLFGSTLLTVAPAAAAGTGSTLVVLSLRGAADGLSLVVPHGDPVYYQARPRIAVPADRLLVKDGMFGLHPKLAPLQDLWTSGRLAAVHAAGLPSVNRSHFAAMEEVEDANPGSTVRQGWLNRLIGTNGTSSPLEGVNIGRGGLPASLAGPEAVMAASSIDSVRIPGDDKWDKNGGRVKSLHTLWDDDSSPLGKGMRSMFGAVRDFEPVQSTKDTSGSYPRSDLGRAMSAVARVIRGDVGTQVITVDQGDWDMHSDLGTADWGRLLHNADDFARSVAAFFADLGGLSDKVTLVAFSEFGRRVKENSNYGVDHGYGNAMFLAGAGVAGGRYHGSWPGLTDAYDADLTVTTDFRDVLGDVVAARFPQATLSRVFPGHHRTPVGVMRAA